MGNCHSPSGGFAHRSGRRKADDRAGALLAVADDVIE
jgi:hypothetical protein